MQKKYKNVAALLLLSAIIGSFLGFEGAVAATHFKVKDSAQVKVAVNDDKTEKFADADDARNSSGLLPPLSS